MKLNQSSIYGSVAIKFVDELSRTRESIVVSQSGDNIIDLENGFAVGIQLITVACKKGGKLIFIGNGGSAAIASHQAVDYWKNGGLEAIAFNDASLLTCISNDFGYEQVFSEPLKRFAHKGDVLLAISSSGRSPNILRGVETARDQGCHVITMSGFDESNPLRNRGDLNFYVSSYSYGIVEISHLELLHAMLEDIMAFQSNAERR